MNIASVAGNNKVMLNAVIIGIAMTFASPVANMQRIYNSYQAFQYL